MRVVQRFRYFVHEAQRAGEGQLAFAREPLAQRFAVDERHDEIEQAVGLARVVDRKDVRMVERRGNGDLAQEPLADDSSRHLGVQHLDRDPAVVLVILRHVHRGHAPAAAFGHQFVCTEPGAGRKRLAGGPGEERGRVSRRARAEEAVAGRGCGLQQALDLGMQLLVAGALPSDKVRPPLGGKVEGSIGDPGDVLPSRRHCPVHRRFRSRHALVIRSFRGGARRGP